MLNLLKHSYASPKNQVLKLDNLSACETAHSWVLFLFSVFSFDTWMTNTTDITASNTAIPECQAVGLRREKKSLRCSTITRPNTRRKMRLAGVWEALRTYGRMDRWMDRRTHPLRDARDHLKISQGTSQLWTFFHEVPSDSRGLWLVCSQKGPTWAPFMVTRKNILEGLACSYS